MLLSTATKELEDKERSRDFSVPRVYDGGWKTMVSKKGDFEETVGEWDVRSRSRTPFYNLSISNLAYLDQSMYILTFELEYEA